MVTHGCYRASGHRPAAEVPVARVAESGGLVSSQVKELGLGDYVSLLARRWRWLVGTFVVGLTLVAAFTFTRDEVFQSRTDILILTETSTGQFAFEPEVEERLTRSPVTELQLMYGQKYLEAAAEGIDYTPTLEFVLLAPTDSSDLSDGSVLRVISSESNPQLAQVSAQVFSTLYVRDRNADDLRDVTRGRDVATDLRDSLDARRAEIRAPILELRRQRATTIDPNVVLELDAQIQQLEADSAASLNSLNLQISAVNENLVGLEQAIASLESDNQATRIINDAFLPKNPVSPDVPRNLIFGAIAALLLGLLLATVRELLDSSAKDASELATLADTPIIAAVPQLKRDRSKPGGLKSFADLPDEQTDPYRTLLDSVWLSGNSKRVKTIAITAVRPGLGSTQTAVNMAQAQARSGAAVCLVDASFARPDVLARLGLKADGPGLADLLSDRCVLDDAITSTTIGELDVVGAGLVDRWTADYLRSQRLGDLFAAMGERYELIIVDTSSISALGDSRTVAAQCDGVVVVYDEAASKRDEVVTAVDVLRSAHARPIGLVANRSGSRQQIHLADSST
jgi:capsular exopolysaccharide synthesis family protein